MKPMISIVAAVIAVSASLPAQAEELSFAHFVPPQHTITASLIEPLSDGVAEATGGELTIKVYPGGELGKGPVEQYVRALQGVADITWGLQGYTSSQFPKTMLIELPGAVPGGGHGYDMLWNAYENQLMDEFPGTVPLALWVSEPNIMIMKDHQIRTPADIEGLKIRVAGAVAADVVTALGATPVQMPIPEVYNALQTGLIDGIITGGSAVSDFKLHEVANSYTIGAPLGRISFYVVMNKERYDGLSDGQRQAIDDHSGRALSKSAEDAWNAKADQTIADLKADAGNTVIELSDEEITPFADLTLPVADKVIASVPGGGDVVKAMRGE
ncbi:MAG: TRAP transporter substrate-binding protein [Alphaproteobacteria bacterium]